MLGKKDLIERFSKKGYTKADAAIICHDFLTTLEEIFVEKESICFKGFGTFHCRHRNPKLITDISTGERIMSKPKDCICFTMGNILKREMLTGELEERSDK